MLVLDNVNHPSTTFKVRKVFRQFLFGLDVEMDAAMLNALNGKPQYSVDGRI